MRKGATIKNRTSIPTTDPMTKNKCVRDRKRNMECRTHDLPTLRISGLEMTRQKKKADGSLVKYLPRVLLLMIIIVIYSAMTGSVRSC